MICKVEQLLDEVDSILCAIRALETVRRYAPAFESELIDGVLREQNATLCHLGIELLDAIGQCERSVCPRKPANES